MLMPTQARKLYLLGTLAGSLFLFGCPKQPEVVQAGPGAMGPSATSTTPSTPSAPVTTPAAKPPETPIARATPPAEASLPAGFGGVASSGPGGSQPSGGASSASEMAATGTSGAASAGGLRDVFFRFDDAAIQDSQRDIVNQDLDWLRAHPDARIVIEGNCDERGTPEYNLGLGERRADALKNFFTVGGIAPERISTVSYGSERPFVLGHEESAWKQNRRDHLAAAR